ncbi:MAG: cytochrome P450 [Hyphomonas sp.]
MSLSKLGSQALKRSPHAALAEALQGPPVQDMSIPFFGKLSATVSHAASQELLKDTENFVVDARHAGYKSAFGMPFLPKSLKVLSANVLTMDDPDHRRLRKLVDGPFRRAAVEDLHGNISAQVTRLLDEMEAAGQRDIVAGLFRPLPLQVICDMLGLGENRQHLFALFNGIAAGSTTMGMIRAFLQIGPVQQFFREEFARVRAEPRPGLITELVHAEADGDRMSEEELLAMVFVLFAAGHETTTHLMSCGLYTLFTEPGAMEAARAADNDAMGVIVDEMMRFGGPVQLTKPRFAKADMEFHGKALKRGDKVMALLAAGNLDPAVFDSPLVFDPARRPNRHLGWGGGPHICLGLHLARMESEIAFQQILARYPRLEPAVPVERLKWTARTGLRGVTSLPLSF